MRVILDRIRKGELLPLTEDSFEDELKGLHEDLLNWDHGHPIEEESGI